GVPNGHVHVGRLLSVKIVINYPVRTDLSQLDPRLPTYDRKSFSFPGMEVVAPGYSWDRGRKRELSWGPGPCNFHKAAPWVSVFGVLNGIMGFWDIAPKGIEKSLFKWVFHVRKNPLFHIFGFISVQQFQNLGNLNMVIRGNIHFKAIITDRNGSLC